MKKILFLVACIAVMAIATTQSVNAQTGTFVNVLNPFMPGVVSGGVSPICYNTNPGILTSTAPTGGNATYTYQWQDSLPGGSWSNIVGATALTRNIGNLLQTNSFRLVSFDLCGTVFSNVTTITVYNQFVTGVISGGASPVCYNVDPGAFVGTAANGGAPGTTYQWQQSIDAGLNWTNIIGSTGLNYDPAALFQTTLFRRQDINACVTLTTNVITITVYNQFVAGVISGGISPVCYNIDPGAFTGTAATGGAPGTTYQWDFSTDGGVIWLSIIGATGLNYDPAQLTLTTQFRRQDINTCVTLTTNIITINVYNQFVASVISGGASPVCYNVDPGAFVGTAANGGAPGTAYQWQQSIDAGLNWTNIIGSTGLNYDPAQLTLSTQFRRQDINLCNTLTTNVISIIVYPQFNAGTVGTSQTICYNTTPNALVNLVAPTGGDGTFTYQWQSSTTGLAPWTNIPGANAAAYQPPTMTVPTYFIRVVTAGFGCGSAPSLP